MFISHYTCDTPITSSINSSSQLVINGHHSLNRPEQPPKKAQLQDIYRPIPKSGANGTAGSASKHDNQEQLIPLAGYDNVPIEDEKKKISIPIKKKLTKDEPLLENEHLSSPTQSKKSSAPHNNYMNVDSKKSSSPKRTPMSDDDAPILMPKQHMPMKKSSLMKQHADEVTHSEHYQLPPKDEDDEYQPPLPPKQRHQNNTSRAMVYDFIGSELQELRVALAQFDGNSSIA